MSQHHRNALIEDCLSQTRGNVDWVSGNVGWACMSMSQIDRLASHVQQPLREFGEAAEILAKKTHFYGGVDFGDYTNQGFPDTAVEWAMKHDDQVLSDPIQAMSDWIDTFPRARAAVDAYCASQAKQDLVFIANSSRADNLASPEEALGRRNRGRAM